MYLLPVQGHVGPHGQCPTEGQGHAHAHDKLNRLRVLLSRLQLGPRATGGGCPRPVGGHSRAVTKRAVGKGVGEEPRSTWTRLAAPPETAGGPGPQDGACWGGLFPCTAGRAARTPAWETGRKRWWEPEEQNPEQQWRWQQVNGRWTRRLAEGL